MLLNAKHKENLKNYPIQIMTNVPINLFDSQICVDCGLPCHFGSGRFVNRYSVYNDDVEGWRCGDCAVEVDALLEEVQND